MNRDIYQAITERFIEQLKRGTVPWRKPWFSRSEHRLAKTLPRNQRLAARLDGLPIPVLDQLQAGARPWRPCQEGREIHSRSSITRSSKSGTKPGT